MIGEKEGLVLDKVYSSQSLSGHNDFLYVCNLSISVTYARKQEVTNRKNVQHRERNIQPLIVVTKVMPFCSYNFATLSSN